MPQKPSAPDGLTRRRFLTLASVVPALGLAHSLTRAATGAATAALRPARRIPIGLELYSVRTELARDLPQTLKDVAAIGYEAVEFYSPYFQWTPAFAKDVRRQLDDLGLRCLSTHNSFDAFAASEGIGKAIELNTILGARQVVLASAPKSARGVDGWKALAAQLTTASEQLHAHGLVAGYHNHQTEWTALENGQRIMDLLADNTPPQFVLQLDVGTCLEAGADPVAWIRDHPGRIRSIHLKDWAPGTEAEEKSYRVLFNEGVAPWAKIVEAAESVGGVEVYLLEQEGSRFSEMETARRCLANWNQFRA
ncbi:MAG TPA: sugar phosphate isomerase/epimerase [Opitutus sp.]|nr:sugar phosphate isomerase/epimerase [Opitutus sp.]